MNILKYIIPLMLLGLVSCRDFHLSLGGDEVLAKVDTKELLESELKSAIPPQYSGEDSVIFAELYIERWIRKQVKLREAEHIFIDSESDIEARVEEYRQSLLIKKLDESYVAASIDTVYTDREIENYYNAHSSNFKLNHDIVKGEVLRLPVDNSQKKKVEELLNSSSETARKDLISICEKNDFELSTFTESWVESTAILDRLPLVRGDQTQQILSVSGVNHMSDDNFDYFYSINEFKKIGDVAPLEWVRTTIRSILITERQLALIKERENILYDQATESEIISRPYKKGEKEEDKI